MILRNLEDLKEFRKLLNIEKLEYLLKTIENVNPKIRERIKTSKEEIEI
ncbi:MAG: hypothetical protein QW806_08675 [Nitrososphaerota archaeon]